MKRSIIAATFVLLASQASALTIDFYSDSTGLGLQSYGGVNSFVDTPPIKQVQMALDAKFGAGVHTITNFSIGGMWIAKAMSDPVYPGSKTLSQNIAARNADIVILGFGINDIYQPTVTAASFKASIETIKAQTDAAGKKLIYYSPNPISADYPTRLNALSSFVASVKTIPNFIVWDYFNQNVSYYPNWSTHLSDTIHPNAIMYSYRGLTLGNSLATYIGGL